MSSSAAVTLKRQEEESRPRARRLTPIERRTQLLRCALRVFARRGLGEARHAEIAKEAGVSVPTVFFYFPSRADLLTAVLDEVERFYYEMAKRIHGRGLPAPRLMLDHAVTFANSVDTHPDYARVWLDWSTAIRDEVWPRYLEFQGRVVRLIEQTIRRGQREGALAANVDPGDEAHLMFISAHMIAQMKFARESPERIERFLQTLVHIAVGGLPPADVVR
jgi:TetR/AcrR family transcriptional regulator, hemagglutinin/protease regulatory protein